VRECVTDAYSVEKEKRRAATRHVNVRAIRARLVIAFALVAAPLSAAHAGPPFLTDDPDPTDYQQYEIYLYSQGVVDGGANTGTALGLEVNYGALPDVQVSVALPAGFSAPARSQATFGVSDAEFGVKYRFLEEEMDGWRPQVSFYPAVQAALGSSGKSLGDSATHLFLPLWAQKSFGPWTTFGGGGYRINPGPDGRNSWFAGWAVLRRISDRFQMGAEIYHETSETSGEKETSGASIGALYDLSDRFHLVGSAGPSTTACCRAAALSYYLALEWTP
jgi:hypothetical protein